MSRDQAGDAASGLLVSAAAGAGRVAVRAAEPADVPTMLRFIQELAEYERLSHEVIADEALLARALFGERPAAEAAIGSWDGNDAGFVLFFQTFSTFLARPGLYVEDLFVTPGMRGLGIGRTLLRHVAQRAIERDCGRLEWSVLDWNEPAIRFYERAGARPLSDWTMYRMTGDTLAEFASGGGDG